MYLELRQDCIVKIMHAILKLPLELRSLHYLTPCHRQINDEKFELIIDI